MKSMEKMYLTRKEFATYFNLSVATVTNMIAHKLVQELRIQTQSGQWPTYCYRIHRDEIKKIEAMR